MKFILIYSYLVIFIKNTNSTEKEECKADKEIDKYIKSGRLPDFIKPSEYFITYIFNEDLSSFKATTEIKIIVLNRTKLIILHTDRNSIISTHLRINDTKYHGLPNENVISSICYIPSLQFIVIKLQEFLEKSTTSILSFSFIGTVSAEYKGIYSAFYKTKELQKR